MGCTVAGAATCMALGMTTASLAVVQATPVAAAPAPNVYVQTNLVSDIPGVARVTDPLLVNPWGMSFSPTGPLWVSDNHTNVSTLYAGAVNGSALTQVPLVVDIPGGAPTGQVFNGTSDFVVHGGGTSAPALFIFASESGHITAWSPNVPPPSPATRAHIVATTPGAVYKGLALGTIGDRSFLYAANFSAGTIDVFNGRFRRAHLAGSFTDPNLPAGYSPFNVQNLGGKLYVTYAVPQPSREDDVPGPGHGIVDVFDLQGRLQRRLISHGVLNSPWGLAIAPGDFGRFSHALLVGNFGDGRINAFNRATGKFLGTLKNADGNPIAIDGLWALLFGNGTAGTTHTLLFSAGLADEEHGLLGTIEAAA
jgi:uncharacterized protein (TIGR03118 family)